MSEAVAINPPNLWRLETPGHAGWGRTARAGDANKYFMVSTDSHANEPADLWATRIDAKYKERVPRIITDEKGVQWRYCEGYRPDRVRVSSFEGEDWRRAQAGAGAAFFPIVPGRCHETCGDGGMGRGDPNWRPRAAADPRSPPTPHSPPPSSPGRPRAGRAR